MKTVTIQSNIFACLEQQMDINKNYVLIVDKKLAGMHSLLAQILASSFKIETIYIDAQESNKNLSCVESIIDYLIALHADRNTVLIAYGGGVLCDITGLVSLLYKRGVELILIPTTFLAMVDTCYGGKVGVDLGSTKNVIGGFKKANAIYIDPTLLQTLPRDIFLDGMYEVLKYAILQDIKLFKMISTTSAFDAATIQDIIKVSLLIKAHYVEQDFNDTGIRAMLNLSHLFAHAIEEQSNFKISHGRAVGQGIYFTALISLKKGYLTSKDFNTICETLSFLDLNPESFKSNLAFLDYIQNDKQISNEQVNFTIIKKIGECELITIKLEEFKEMLL